MQVKSPPDVKPVAQAAIVQITDQPLDLSQPTRLKDASGLSQPTGSIAAVNSDKRNFATTVQRCKYILFIVQLHASG